MQGGRGDPSWLVTMKSHETVDYLMTLRGSRKPNERWGSMIQVDEIGMKLIPAQATPAQRKTAGCVLPGVVADGAQTKADLRENGKVPQPEGP